MSLDVYLEYNLQREIPAEPKIYIREDGQVKEISRAEWNERYPDREPVVFDEEETTDVYWANITHNLAKMADKAGIYEHLWRPDEIGITKAHQLIIPLNQGLVELESNPEKYKQFNPSNGWGTYEGLIRFVDKYLNACMTYPDATIRVSR